MIVNMELVIKHGEKPMWFKRKPKEYFIDLTRSQNELDIKCKELPMICNCKEKKLVDIQRPAGFRYDMLKWNRIEISLTCLHQESYTVKVDGEIIGAYGIFPVFYKYGLIDFLQDKFPGSKMGKISFPDIHYWPNESRIEDDKGQPIYFGHLSFSEGLELWGKCVNDVMNTPPITDKIILDISLPEKYFNQYQWRSLVIKKIGVIYQIEWTNSKGIDPHNFNSYRDTAIDLENLMFFLRGFFKGKFFGLSLVFEDNIRFWLNNFDTFDSKNITKHETFDDGLIYFGKLCNLYLDNEAIVESSKEEILVDLILPEELRENFEWVRLIIGMKDGKYYTAFLKCLHFVLAPIDAHYSKIFKFCLGFNEERLLETLKFWFKSEFMTIKRNSAPFITLTRTLLQPLPKLLNDWNEETHNYIKCFYKKDIQSDDSLDAFFMDDVYQKLKEFLENTPVEEDAPESECIFTSIQGIKYFIEAAMPIIYRKSGDSYYLPLIEASFSPEELKRICKHCDVEFKEL